MLEICLRPGTWMRHQSFRPCRIHAPASRAVKALVFSILPSNFTSQCSFPYFLSITPSFITLVLSHTFKMPTPPDPLLEPPPDFASEAFAANRQIFQTAGMAEEAIVNLLLQNWTLDRQRQHDIWQ